MREVVHCLISFHFMVAFANGIFDYFAREQSEPIRLLVIGSGLSLSVFNFLRSYWRLK